MSCVALLARQCSTCSPPYTSRSQPVKMHKRRLMVQSLYRLFPVGKALLSLFKTIDRLISFIRISISVEFNQHYYSVPYSLVGQEVEICYTAATVEIFHKHKRVASHRRCDYPRQHTTVSGHMPKSHREYQEWSPSRIITWAEKIRRSHGLCGESYSGTAVPPGSGLSFLPGDHAFGQELFAPTLGCSLLPGNCSRRLQLSKHPLDFGKRAGLATRAGCAKTTSD